MDDAGTIVSEYIGTDGFTEEVQKVYLPPKDGREIGCWRQKRMGPIIIQNSLMPCMQQTGKLEGTR